MVHMTFASGADLDHSGVLDWIIGAGFVSVVGAIGLFRLLAIWQGWLSDDD